MAFTHSTFEPQNEWLCLVEICKLLKHYCPQKRRELGIPEKYAEDEGFDKLYSRVIGALQMMMAVRVSSDAERGQEFKDKATQDFKFLLDCCGERGLKHGEEKVFDSDTPTTFIR
jgi:hypothetical protein